MEVVIAIAVGAVVLSILSSALSLAVKSWEKAMVPPDTIGGDLVNLLTIQLMHMHNAHNPKGSKNIKPLFIGRSNGLAFTTNFSVLGLSRNSPVLACYKYDPQKKVLFYGQVMLHNIASAYEDLAPRYLNILQQENREDEKWDLQVPLDEFILTYWTSDEGDQLDTWEVPEGEPYKVKIQMRSKEGPQTITKIVYVNWIDILNGKRTGKNKP